MVSGVGINVLDMVTSENDTQELVKISGKGALLNIHVDDRAPLEIACRALRERLARERNLYSEGDAVVNIGRRLLSEEHQTRIRKVIEAESGLKIQQFLCDPSVLAEERNRISAMISKQAEFFAPAKEPDGGDSANGHAPELKDGRSAETRNTPQSTAAANGIEQNGPTPGAPAHIVHGTFRAGDAATFPGNVVIVGNVNPGAQIIARGDIIVYGTLRGLAHAGAGGDQSAVVLAMSAINPQLRIAQYIWEAEGPDPIAGSRAEKRTTPIIAQVTNRSVRISPYPRNHANSNGGNLNER